MPPSRWRLGAAFALALLVVLAGHGLLPGLVPDNPATYTLAGSIRCLYDAGLGALTGYCQAMGYPLGFPIPTGLPVSYLGAALMTLPGLGSYGASQAAQGLVDGLALAAGYGLARRLGASRPAALAAAALFLISPTVVGLRGFGGTFNGFVLLPAYALVDMALAERLLRPATWWTRGALLAGYAGVRTWALFMDGYSFVVSAALGGALWLWWGVRRTRSAGARVTGAAAVVGGNGLAFLAYQAYVPGGSTYEPSPLAAFRAMGLDLATALRPGTDLLLARVPGLGRDFADLWGDGTNAAWNFLGLASLLLAGTWAVRMRRRPWVAPLVLAGAGAFVLALGPSLKWSAEKPASATGWPVPPAAYAMPERAAVVPLPTAWAYEQVPGLSLMRASYRWVALTRLVVVLGAVLMLDDLARRSRGRRRRALAVAALGAIVVVETMPDPSRLLAEYRANALDLARFRGQVLADLQAATRPGDRVVFAQGGNPYLVNYLAPEAGLRAYNVGGDKNGALSARRWPREVPALLRAPDSPAAARAALGSGQVDALVLPTFSLRWDAYDWPPDGRAAAGPGVVDRAAVDRLAGALEVDPGLVVRRYAWLTVVSRR